MGEGYIGESFGWISGHIIFVGNDIHVVELVIWGMSEGYLQLQV